MKKRSLKYQAIFRFVLAVVIVLLLNFIFSQYFTRFDLTTEKRYSLASSTKTLLNGLDDVVYVKVYLEGNFPAAFKRLRNAAKETLDDFQTYSRNNIEYVFINPLEGSEDFRKNLEKELRDKGLIPKGLTAGDGGVSSQQKIFPAAVFSYHGREVPVNLLENQIGFEADRVLNNSVELLEYKFASAIKKLTQRARPRILFTRGHGELPDRNIRDMVLTLQRLQYSVDTIDLRQADPIADTLTWHKLVFADMLVVAKPTLPFREQEKFKIDQFIMNGGRVLWLIDAMDAELDSLRGEDHLHFSLPYPLNLDDQLFKYGVRLNSDLLQDVQCNFIALPAKGPDGQVQTELYQWPYYPLIFTNNEHAIVRNLDAIALRFAGTIDLVGRDSALVKKIPLLHSSPRSKALMSPVRVHFSMLQAQPDINSFQQQGLILGALLEGTFESVFKNRVAGSFAQSLDSVNQPFRDKSFFTRMIVISDGDVIKNYPGMQLGFYPATQQTFSNKDFLLNCIEYLVDDVQLIETRNKEIRLRLLDNEKVRAEATKWQFINVGAPLLATALFGILFYWVRRRRYAG